MNKSNWSGLPIDLLTAIANKLILIKDYIQFGVTCLTWHNVFANNRDRLPQQPPMLMIPNKKQKQKRSVYSLSDEKVYGLQVSVPHNLNCRGSSFGWLFTVDDESLAVRLINPFLSINNEIRLPSLDSLEIKVLDDMILKPTHLRKAVLSANPALTPDYVVLVIYGRFSRLGFVKPGDKTWTSIDLKWRDYEDAIYYKDHFYAVDCKGKVVVCDLNSSHPKLKEVTPTLPMKYWPYYKYIVESLGELLLVRREMYHIPRVSNGKCKMTNSTDGFQVFKLDAMEPKWVEVKSLHGRVFFLGDNSSMSLSALDFPGCKPNCIYFTDDEIESASDFVYESHDIGVFNLENRSFEPHSLMESPMIRPPPIWVEPTLQVCFH